MVHLGHNSIKKIANNFNIWTYYLIIIHYVISERRAKLFISENFDSRCATQLKQFSLVDNGLFLTCDIDVRLSYRIILSPNTKKDKLFLVSKKSSQSLMIKKQ